MEMRTTIAVGVGCKLFPATGMGARCGCFRGQVVAAGFWRAAGEVPGQPPCLSHPHGDGRSRVINVPGSTTQGSTGTLWLETALNVETKGPFQTEA